MNFLDANIILRYVTGDDPVKAKRCFELFQRVKAGEEVVTTCEAVIAEVVYVLSSSRLYNLPRDQIRARLVPILSLKGFHLAQLRLYLRALDTYVAQPQLDFEDALLIEHMTRRKATAILTYDRGFDRVVHVTRLEP